MIEGLAGRNLNHLVVLAVLLEEANVTKAAKRLGLSQSATSHALAALREQFGDELLVRTSRGMVPTEYGARLRPQLQMALVNVSHVVQSRAQFDVRSYTGTFTLAAADFLIPLLGRELAHQLSKKMPHGSLRLETVRLETLAEKLLGREIDAAIAPPVPLDPAIQAEIIIEERWVTALAADHPLAKRRARKDQLRLQEFVGLEHAVVSPSRRGSSAVDDQLAALGLQRHVRARFDSFSGAAAALVGSRLVLTAPRLLFRDLGRKVRLFEPPVSLAPLRLALHLDKARAASPEVSWFADEVRRAASWVER